jgi:hypothetical protein
MAEGPSRRRVIHVLILAVEEGGEESGEGDEEAEEGHYSSG